MRPRGNCSLPERHRLDADGWLGWRDGLGMGPVIWEDHDRSDLFCLGWRGGGGGIGLRPD